MGQGDDLVTVTRVTGGSAGSLVDLGEGADTFTAVTTGGQVATLTNISIKGFGGLDTINFNSAAVNTNLFVNGNEGADRLTLGAGGGTTFTNCTIVGGSENDTITVNTSIALTGGRINGQNGDDTITFTQWGAATTTTVYGGQGNDILTAANIGGTNVVRFSGDLGNDTIDGNNQANNVSGDRLFAGDGNDSINGEGGLDSLTGGAGTDTFVFGGNNTTMRALVTAAGANVAVGDSLSIGGAAAAANFNNDLCVITDFAAGDILNTVNGTQALSGIGTAVAGGNTFGIAGNTYYLSGAYNQANSTFTVTANNAGTDTLLLLNGNTAGGFVLLQGTNSSVLTAGAFI